MKHYTYINKYISNILLMIAMVSMALTSCGGDDSEEEQANTEKQRIEMTISGNTKGWVISANFFGYTTDPSKPDQTCTLLCNQTEYVFKENNNITVMTGGSIQRSYPVVVTLEGKSNLLLNLQVTKNGEYSVKDVPDITITLNGYKGSKLTNTFSKAYKSSTIAVIGFHADKNDGKVGVEGEYSQDIHDD